MFEQHYLANMFAGEDPEFLRTKVRVESSVAISKPPKDEEEGLARATVNQTEEECAGKTVAELSRLWRYKVSKILVTSGIFLKMDRMEKFRRKCSKSILSQVYKKNQRDRKQHSATKQRLRRVISAWNE